MTSFLRLTAQDFYVSFPEVQISEEHTSLKLKCGKFGILQKPNDQRQEISFVITPHDKGNFGISNKELKNWFNIQGTDNPFAEISEKEYENWKELLYSKQEENILVALSILNTRKRPVAKYFSLWIAMALFHKSQKVRSTARSLASVFINEDSWTELELEGGASYVRKNFESAENSDFINLNYYQSWINTLTDSKLFFKHSYTKYFETDALAECWKEFNLSEVLQNSHSFCLKISDNTLSRAMDFLFEKLPDATYLGLSSATEIKFEYEPLARFKSLTTCHFNNIIFGETHTTESFGFDLVSSYSSKGTGGIKFQSSVFPNLQYLTLEGPVAQELELNNFNNTLTLILKLSETQDIPDSVYQSPYLTSLNLYFRKGVKVDARIRQMQQLIEINFGGKTSCLQLPDELFKLPKLVNIFEIDHKILAATLKSDNAYLNPSAMITKGESLTEFPYYLSKIKNLKQLCFREHEIEDLDERMAQFKNLFQISFPDGSLKQIPDKLRLVPRLCWLDLHRQQIQEISFEWVVFTYTRKLLLNLGGNPIKSLPPIPEGFSVEGLEIEEIESFPGERRPTYGSINLDRGIIDPELVERYHEVFGERFLNA